MCQLQKKSAEIECLEIKLNEMNMEKDEKILYDLMESSLNALCKAQESGYYFKIITKKEFEKNIKEKVRNS